MHESGVVALKLLTITRNKPGSSFVPWRTLAVIGSQLEIASDCFTCCSLVFVVHGFRDQRTPKSKSFLISKLYPIGSKALEKSRNKGGDGDQVWSMIVALEDLLLDATEKI